MFRFVLDEMELDIEQITEGVSPAALARVPDEPTTKSGEKTRAVSAAPASARPSAASDMREAKSVDTIRVPAERLDELMDRVGQLVIAQSRLKEIAAASNDAAMKSVTEDIERLSLELRDTTMGVRMLPIGQLFNRFRRLIHNLARDHGKNGSSSSPSARRPSSTRP